MSLPAAAIFAEATQIVEPLAEQVAALRMNLISLRQVSQVIDRPIEAASIEMPARGPVLEILQRFHHFAEMVPLVPVHARAGPDVLHIA